MDCEYVPQYYSVADSEIAGSLLPSRSPTTIRHRDILTKDEKRVTALFSGCFLLTITGFLVFAVSNISLMTPLQFIVGTIALTGFIFVEALRWVQGLFLMMCTWMAKDPIPLTAPPGLRVAILTTIIPSKEPIALVRLTLEAMRRITYNGTVDVWILDEGDDAEVKAMAAEIGVRHFSRKGKPEYHQDRGPYREKTKSGNHNSWRHNHEHEYDIVAQMDPDHVPFPNFLERTLGYFRDPDVGFVVAPQVYGNLNECFVARGAAEHAYIFHGIIQRAGGVLGTPVLIGTNHLYRTTAWNQMGGYQDCIIEDHLTSITLHGMKNPETGEHWKGIYTPDILSIGEGPTTWVDYFNQQKRWAYGIGEILQSHSSRLLPSIPLHSRLFYFCIELFYPGVAVTFILSLLMCLATTMFGNIWFHGSVYTFVGLWLCNITVQTMFFIWMQRFNLTQHERDTNCGTAMLLTLITAPIYTAAFIQLLSKRTLGYVVTPKGKAKTESSLDCFTPHLIGLACYLPIIMMGFLWQMGPGLYWSIFTAVTLLPLPVMHLFSKWRVA